jgi:hypothetical protein
LRPNRTVSSRGCRFRFRFRCRCRCRCRCRRLFSVKILATCIWYRIKHARREDRDPEPCQRRTGRPRRGSSSRCMVSGVEVKSMCRSTTYQPSAAHSVLPHRGGALVYRAKPLTDDISEQRYKPAESTIARHLKKHPKSQPALVLRMVLLEKTGKSSHEVLRAYQDVKGTGELSARSMWWTCLTLRGIGRRECGVAAWFGGYRRDSCGLPDAVRSLDSGVECVERGTLVHRVTGLSFRRSPGSGVRLVLTGSLSDAMMIHAYPAQKTSSSSCTNPSGTPTRSRTTSGNRSSSTPRRWATGIWSLRRAGRCSINRRTRCGRGSQRGENGLG